MKALHLIALVLVIIGALNWGLVGAFNFNLVAALLGPDSVLSNIVYVLVGLSGLVVAYTEFAMHKNLAPRALPRHA